jgi:FlaA1/EpsC-like NDP-sugar epimerase
MRIWLIGAGQAGSEALRQFQKNPGIEIFVTDMIDRPKAVTDRIIDKLDAVENVTPMNVNTLARRIRPDLILIDSSALKRNLTQLSGGMVYAEALQNEIAATADYPCIVI